MTPGPAATVLALALAASAADGPGGATAAPPPAARARKVAVAPLVDTVFRREFAFCHDPRYALTPDELEWCALMPKEADRRCPRLREACGLGATAARTNRGERAAQLVVPGLGEAAAWALWVLLGCGAAYLIVELVRHRLAFGVALAGPARERPHHAADDAEAAAARAVETDVERLLQQARAAAAAGDFRTAIDEVYAALLRKLEGSGVLRVEPHCTNGDHVREVGRKLPALRPGVEALLTKVERVQFGGDPADEPRFRAILDGALGLMGQRLAQVLPLVAGMALAAVVAGCTVDRGRGEEAPSGRAAVLAFLQQDGFEVRDRLLPLEKIDETVRQLVLLPGAAVDKRDWEALGRWVGDGGTLLVAGGARALPDWIDGTISSGSAAVSGAVAVASDQAARFPPGKGRLPPGPEVRLGRGAHAELSTDEAPAHLLLLRGGALYAIEQEIDGGRVILLADDGLFTNASLLVAGNAQLLADLVMDGGKHLELAGDLTGLVASNPVSSIQRGQLAPALLQLALVALLFFAYRGVHFGRPVDPTAAHRRAFSEHVRALGLQYARGRASRHALEAYGSYALERLRERLHLRGNKSLHGVAEAVAARTGRPVGEVMRLMVYAHPESPETRSPAFAAEDLATLREIATLLTATGGAGERTRGRGQA